MSRGFRLAWWAGALCLLAAVAIALTVALDRLTGEMAQTSAIGGPFRLVDDNGKSVTEQDFRGKWLLVYFGYTHCPDACPTALSHIDNALDEIGPKRAVRIAPLFVTVDPDRDTPAVMHDYLSSFDVHIYGLSGSQDQIAAAEARYHVYAAKHPDPGGGYSMDHSSIIYVMDPSGQFVASFTHETSVDEMVAKLRELGA